MRHCPRGHEISGVEDVTAVPMPPDWPMQDDFELVCRRCCDPFGPAGEIAAELKAFAEALARRLPHEETSIGKWGRWRAYGAGPHGSVSSESTPHLTLECVLHGHDGCLVHVRLKPWEYLDPGSPDIAILLLGEAGRDPVVHLARAKMRKAIARLQDFSDTLVAQTLDEEESYDELSRF